MLKQLSAIALAFVFVFPAATATAQEGIVAGTVVDSTTSESLPGVNVVVEELNVGAATDPQGEFTISGVPAGSQTLVASFVGYATKRVPIDVTAGDTTEVRIEMTSAAVALEDVVVTALGIEREERSLGYAVSQVDGADIERTSETNFISNLTGRVAGAQVNASSNMGGSSRIVLRGPGSVGGNNEPLIVIDGVPLDNSNFTTTTQASGSGGYDYGNAASIINPADVQSISVLKGPSAAALYGSRAANGVIEITTRSGSREGGENIGVTVQTGVTFNDLYNFVDYQDEYGGGAWAPFAMNEEGQLVADFSTDQSWGPPLDGREVRQWYSYDEVNGQMGQATPWVAHPDNVQDFFETGATFNTNVAFSQGGENFNYRASVNNVTESGVSPGSELSRNTIGFKGSLDLTDRLTTSISANYIYEDAEKRLGAGYNGAVSPWQQFNTFGQRQIDLSDGAPMRDLRRPDGTQRSWNWLGVEGAQSGDIIYANNPFWTVRENYPSDDMQRLYGNFRVGYDLVNNLILSGSVRTDFYTSRRQERVAVGSVEQPQYTEDVREVQETNGSVELNYDGPLTEMFSLQAVGGATYRYRSIDENLGTTQGGLSTPDLYTLENSISRPDIRDYFQEQGLFGLYADATFGYLDMVYIGGSVRNDWSSTLPEDNNSYFYPSVRASFVFTSLPALENQNVLSYGKVRVNWSEVGRDTDPYQLAFTYPLNTPYGSTPVQTLPAELNNSDLKPEITSGWEVGAQLQFFNNRLGVDATYYDQETRNQILSVESSRASSFRSRVINAGKISNKGVELALNLTPVLTQDFSWDFTVNWAQNINEVEDLAAGVEQVVIDAGSPPFGPNIVAREGEPYGTFFGNAFIIDEATGEKVLNPDGTYALETDQVLGNYQPDWTAGVSTTISYQGFSVSALVDGQKGGDIWSLTNLFGLYSGITQETIEDDMREVGLVPRGVTAEGEPFESRVDPNAFFTGFFGAHEMTLYDASYIKLREVSLSYMLPGQWLTGVPALQGLTVSAIGRNLATLYKETPNFDPSAVTLSAGNAQGIEVGQLPPVRSYGFRLTLAF